GPRGAPAGHSRADPAEAEREERQGGSDRGAPPRADDPLCDRDCLRGRDCTPALVGPDLHADAGRGTPDGVAVAIPRSDLAARAAALRWYHSIDLGDGIVTTGVDDTPVRLAQLDLPASLAG